MVIALVSILLLFSIVLMGVKSSNEMDQIVQQQYNEQQLLLARQISTSIEEFLIEKVNLLESLAKNEPDLSPEEYQILFRDIYDGSSGFYALEFINDSGVVVTGYPEENVPIGYNLYENNKEWAVEHVKETKMTYATNPLELFEGGLGSFIWVPVLDGDDYKGTILGIIRISTLSEKYLEPYNSSGYVYLIDRKGQVLYDGSGQHALGENYFEILNDSNSIWLQIIREQVNGSEGTSNYIEYYKDGTKEDRIIAYSPIHWNRRLWSVAVTSPVSEVKAIVHSVFVKQAISVGISGGITLLGGLSIIFLLVKWNKSLELEVEKKTRELKQSNEFLDKANKKLKELDKMKSDFVAMVSHELKTPLISIKTSAELLKSGKDSELFNESELLDKIIKSADRQIRMVNDLLDLAQIESGMINFKKEQVDLRRVIDISIETVEKIAYDLGISIHTSIPDELSSIRGNKDALVSVFVNLLNNSMRFTPWGGRININVAEQDDYIEVTVMDNGIGIKPEELDNMFEKFYRIDIDPSHDSDDTGLGMAIAKGIVERHGGTIHAESKEGEGTSIIFTLKK